MTETLSNEVASLGIRVSIVGPGSFRTGFAGDVNLRPANRIESYRSVVSPVEDYFEGAAGKELGDPSKAAAVNQEAVDNETAPTRRMLGKDAYDLWGQTIASRIDEINSWRVRGTETAFADVDIKPIGG